MAEPSNSETFVPQDLDMDGDGDVNDMGLAETISQTEIDDLLYSDALPAEERLARLNEIREQLRARRVSEMGDDDASGLLIEVLRAIDELKGSLGEREDEPDAYAPLDPPLDIDPSDHIETLSPDDSERYALDGEDDDVVFVSEEEAMGAGDEDSADGTRDDENKR